MISPRTRTVVAEHARQLPRGGRPVFEQLRVLGGAATVLGDDGAVDRCGVAVCGLDPLVWGDADAVVAKVSALRVICARTGIATRR
jgi:hypothetical protein|eukprot:COSAG01_NODE_185_length_22691_cov_53.142478_10_plen_86_part_00